MEQVTTPLDTKKTSRLTLISKILLLIIVAATIATGIFQYQNNKKTLALLTNSQKQIAADQKNIQQLQKNVADLSNQIRQHQTAFANLQLNPNDHTGWVVAETNYLAQLANYNLVFIRDVPTTIALLKAADQRLASLNSAAYAQARQLLADAIVALEAVPQVDVAGLLAQINALQMQATQLPILQLASPTETLNNDQQTNTVTPNWQSGLNKSLETFQKLIVIRHSNHPVEPLLPAQQQAYLQQNIQLLLQQAQWAALRGQSTIYQASLQQAMDWIQRYFVANATITDTMVKAITDLQKINIQPALPDIKNVLQTLEHLPIAPKNSTPETATHQSRAA